MTKLQNIKKLAITKLTEHKSAYGYNETDPEMKSAIRLFEEKIDGIIETKNEKDAFDEIVYFAKREHEYHKEFLKWSDDEIEASLVEFGIEVDNL